jgi:hypothetical protein
VATTADCSGGRVKHPATHKEVVKLKHWRMGDDKQVGYICLEHKTSADDWELDDWEVVSIKRSKL